MPTVPDVLLAAAIPLPTAPTVVYASFSPLPDSPVTPSDAIELARRHILARHAASVVLDSLLTSVHIGPPSALYVFLLSAHDRIAAATSTLASLRFDGLSCPSIAHRSTATDISSFALDGLYPCSANCGLLSQPCPNCPGTPPPSTPASLLPRRPLRHIYSHFLEAVRIRLLNDIAEASLRHPSLRQVKRLKGGFLLGPTPSATQWADSWAYRTLSKPLLYCQLQIYLSRNSIPSLIVHPQLRPTHFLPLAYTLPLPSGTPITLLPHETPAFFLTHYSGPTSAIAKQFRDSFQGMGVCGWDSPTPLNEPSSSPQFIIAWIGVENKQGEDKGIVVIYPTTLCLSVAPSPSAPSRSPLQHIPQLPAPLQPSPQAPTTSRTSTPFDHIPLSASAPTPIYLPARPILPSPSTTDYLRAFRTLTLSKAKDLGAVAADVGSYVDAVARERERERERLKRERENGTSTSPRLSRSIVAAPPVTPALVPILTDTSAPLPATPLPSAAPSHSTIPAQNFYPSPPQTNTTIAHPPPSLAPTAAVLSVPVPVAPETVLPPTSPATPAGPTSAAIPSSSLNTASLDPFGTGNPSWTMEPQAYLGINMDMDMDFDMGMGMDMDMGFDMNSGSRGGGAFRGTGIDFDDSAFTDDDFNFFDRPAAPEPLHGVTSHSQIQPPYGQRVGSSSVITPPPRPSLPLGLSSAANIAHAPSSAPLFSSGVHLSVPGPPLPLLQQAPLTPSVLSPWLPESFPPRFTSNLPAPPSSGNPALILPDLVPPSPGQSPFSQSAPATPYVSVHLESDPAVVRRSTGLATGTGTRIFDPIPFAAYHRELDGKYAVGKFSLPSPPDEEDRTVPSSLSLDSSFYGKLKLGPSYLPRSVGRERDGFTGIRDMKSDDNNGSRNGWRLRYMAATDPRVGVVKKLIGVKRKMTEQGGREKTMSPSWVREYEEWAKQQHEKKNTKNKKQKNSSDYHDDDDDISDTDSDPESTASIHSTTTTSSSAPLTSRPSTPLPSYLPLGPALLHTHFQHAELLPLSMPLRPPGSSVFLSSTSGSSSAALPIIPSVPTPVSPAAALGANSEKSRSLEAAAACVASEVVENPLWAEAWSVGGGTTSIKTKRKKKASPAEVWLADVKIVSQLLAGVQGVEGPLDLGTLFAVGGVGAPSTPTQKTVNSVKQASKAPITTPAAGVQMLAAPMITVGKGDAVIQILPPAVRFWEKLGLGPKGGAKNATTFVLFEDEGEQRYKQVGNWLEMVAATYQSKHFGMLVPGESAICRKGGLLPLRFDLSFRKTLSSFLANLPTFNPNLVIFLVTPISAMSLASPTLRQVFSAIKKALKTHTDAPVYFQLVPEHAIYGSLGNPLAFFSDLDTFCTSLYNRILRPVDRSTSRSFFSPSGVQEKVKVKGKVKAREPLRKYFQDPLLTLARPLHGKVSFVRAAHASLGVMDRHTFLHVGYQVSPCGKWVLAACVDQRGEAHELGVWLVQTQTQGTGTPGREGGGDGGAASWAGDGDREDVYTFVVKKVWEFVMEFAKKADVEWRVVVAKLGSVDESELNAWANFLGTALLDRPGIPKMQVAFSSVEPDASWTICSTRPPPVKSPTKTPRPGRSSSMSKNQPQNIFTDVTTTICAVAPYSHLPQSLPPSLADFGPAYIPESPTSIDTLDGTPTSSPSLPHPLALHPPSTTTLICIPASSPSPTAISMLHIHLWHVAHHHHRRSSPAVSQEELVALHTEITRNFHDLSVLAGVQWRMGDRNPLLPFHLAAVEAMRDALDVDWEHVGGGDGAGGDV